MKQVLGTICVALVSMFGIARSAAAQDPAPLFAYSQCTANLDYYSLDCSVGTYPASYANAWGSAPHWSPDGDSLVFYEANYGYIATVSLLNGSATYLTDAYSWNEQPVWGRDGRIAFVSYRNGDPAELYVMNADGSNQTRVTNNTGFLGYSASWAWSPDTTRFAFVATLNYEQEIWMINTDGTGLRQVTNQVGVSRAPVWSADGRRLAFECVGTLRSDICVIDADGTNFRRLTTDPGNDSDPVFSPAGDTIAFTTEMFGSGPEIALIDGSGLVTRLAPGTGGTHAAWSPDGARLLFVGTIASWTTGICYEGSAHNADDFCVPVYPIYVVNADGTGLAYLADGGSPDWRPLGTKPIAQFTTSCIGNSCAFDAAASVGAIGSYSWQFGDGTTASGAAVSHTYNPGATYSVTLTIADTAGATAAMTKTVQANTPPAASFTAACQWLTCTFDATGSSDSDGTLVSYSWRFDDGQTATGTVVTHTYATPGSHSVGLTVTDSGGLSSQSGRGLDLLTQMHVGDLDGSTALYQSTWIAMATIRVHGLDHQPLTYVTVTGTWSDGTIATCDTGSVASCLVGTVSLPKKTTSMTFTVQSVTRYSYVYTPAANHDADGDSNGTKIVVSR